MAAAASIPYGWFGYGETHDPYSGSGSTARAEVRTAWSNVPNFSTFMLGDVTPGAGGNLSRQLPQQHPVYSYMWAKTCELHRGIGAFKLGANGLITYYDNTGTNQAKDATGTSGKAEYGVSYWCPPWTMLGDTQLANGPTGTECDRFVIKTTDYQMEALALQGQSFTYLTQVGGKVQSIPEGLAIQLGLTLWMYVWIAVPDSVWQTIANGTLPSVMGRINTGQLDNMAPGTALCLSPKVGGLYCMPSGNPVRNISFQFLMRQNGLTWNSVWRQAPKPQFPGFDIAEGGGGLNEGPYRFANFLTLFGAS